MANLNEIEISEQTLKDLKTRYNKAIEENEPHFSLEDGTEILIDYAKYLIEYLEMVLKK